VPLAMAAGPDGRVPPLITCVALAVPVAGDGLEAASPIVAEIAATAAGEGSKPPLRNRSDKGRAVGFDVLLRRVTSVAAGSSADEGVLPALTLKPLPRSTPTTDTISWRTP